MTMTTRRDYLKGAGAVLAGTALAGCGEATSGKENVDEDTEYTEITVEEAELKLDDFDHVKVEGHLQYDDVMAWENRDEGPTMLRTYTLYADDPGTVENPDDLPQVRVLEYDEDPMLDSLPEERVANRDVLHTEVYGSTDRMYEEVATDGMDLEREFIIKAHGARLLEE